AQQRDMRGVRTALEDVLGAEELEMQRLDQSLQAGGQLARTGPDDLVVLPVLRLLERQGMTGRLHPACRRNRFLRRRRAEISEREMDLDGRRNAALQRLRPAFERGRCGGRRPDREEV